MRLPIVLVAATALTAACGDSEPVADTSIPTTSSAPVPEIAARLDGHEYVSNDVTGHELVAGSAIRLTFDGANLGAAGGCNQLGGTWSIEGDVLVVPENMVMTEMACEPALMDQDSWLASFLSSGPTATLDGDTLTLTGGDVTMSLLEVADPDRPLEGTEWVLDGLVSADAVSSVPAGVRTPTLNLDDGEVRVDTGCNSGSGSYEVTEQEITFGPIATTRMACDDATMEVEAHVLDVLQGTVSYDIEAGVLTLTNGAAGLTYRVAG